MAGDRDDEAPAFLDGQWRALPRWVRLLSLTVALPAWAILAFGIVTGRIGDTLTNVCLGLFAAVAILEGAFLARAYWRMDL